MVSQGHTVTRERAALHYKSNFISSAAKKAKNLGASDNKSFPFALVLLPLLPLSPCSLCLILSENTRKMGRTVTVIKSDEDDAGLISYYCLRCGKDTMLLSAHLGTYPRRQTDGAYVVDDEAIKSINVATGQVRNILRMNRGAERQHRMDCQMCGTSVAYRSTEIDNVHNERTYVFPGILSCNPTISLDSLDADELAVPEAIGSETVNDQSMVTVKMDITFGAHTLVQVSGMVGGYHLLESSPRTSKWTKGPHHERACVISK